MSIHFSKSTGGFYVLEIHGKNIPADVVEITEAEHSALLSGQAAGQMIVPDATGRPVLAPVCPSPDYDWQGSAWVLNPDRQKKRLIDLIQAHMDAKAQTYGYDNILSAKSYLTSGNATWKAEGEAFRDWQDAVWTFGLSLLAEAAAGTNTITTDEALIAALPVFPLDSQ